MPLLWPDTVSVTCFRYQQVKNVLRLAKEAEVSIFSIGALSKDSILYEVEYLKDEDFQALEKNKAVGDIASRYFDINEILLLKN